MECMHCKSTWNSAMTPTNCPFCGKPLFTEPNHFDTVSDALRYIIRKRSIEVFKSPQLVHSLVCDYVPGCQREKKLLKIACENQAYQYILSITNETIPEQRQVYFRQFTQNLTEDAFLSHDFAQLALGLLMDAVEIPFVPEILPQPHISEAVKTTPTPNTVSLFKVHKMEIVSLDGSGSNMYLTGPVIMKEDTARIGVKIHIDTSTQSRSMHLRWRVYREDGTPVFDELLKDIVIPPGSRWVYHTWGTQECGTWNVGKYYATASVNGGETTLCTFEVKPGSGKKKLTSVRKMEIISKQQSNTSDYLTGTELMRENTAMIGVKLYFDPSSESRTIRMHWRIFRADGTPVFDEIVKDVAIDPGVTWVYHTWGYKTCGSWDVGSYYIKASLDDGEPVITKFEIRADSVKPKGTPVKRLVIVSDDGTADCINRIGKLIMGKDTAYIGILAYFQNKARVDSIRLTWQIFKKDGTPMFSQLVQEFHISPTSNWVSQKWGWKECGNWPAGEYYVTASLDGGEPVRANFEIRDKSYDSLKGELKNVRLFGYSGTQSPPMGKRNYATEFSSTVSYINFEVEIPRQVSSLFVTMEYTIHDTKGNQICNSAISATIGSNANFLVSGYGSDDPGFWKPGAYYYKVRVGKSPWLYGQFKVK